MAECMEEGQVVVLQVEGLEGVLREESAVVYAVARRAASRVALMAEVVKAAESKATARLAVVRMAVE